jgi:DNA-binding transcriptional regulator YiaG
MEQKFVVYQHLRKDTNEVFYIGIGDKQRPYTKSGRNKIWTNIFKKHGHIVEVIYEVDTWSQAGVIEIMLIEKYGRRGLDKKGVLANRTKGGDGSLGLIHSEETKKNLSNLFKGENGSQSKLTWKEVKEIRELYRPYDRNFSIRSLAERFNISKTVINQVLDNEIWVDENYVKSNYYGNDVSSVERRKLMSECMKTNHPFKGQKLNLTEEGRKKIIETSQGENHGASVLTEENVRFIRKHYKPRDKKYNYYTFAEMFNTRPTTIMYVVQRKTWTHI